MRQIAKEAGLSVGAAYHHFDSKQAIVAGYYEAQIEAHSAAAREALVGVEGLSERLRIVMHTALDTRASDRVLMRELAPLVVSGTDLSVFSSETTSLRERSMGLFREALEGSDLPDDLREVTTTALWTLQLGLLLYFANDESLGQRRTRDLVDGSLSLVLTVFGALGMPVFAPVRAELNQVLTNAGLLGGPMTD